MVNTSGGLLRDTIAVLEEVRVLLVDKSSEVSTIIEDEVELLAILERDELLLKAPVVFLLSLTLPSETVIFVSIRNISTKSDLWNIHWDTCSGNSGSSMILGREDVAAGPCALRTKGSKSPVDI